MRLDQLEEGIQCVKGLLSGEPFDFEGQYFQMHAARCEPGPVQSKIPLTIGGTGEKRSLKIAATYADSWNSAYITLDQFAHASVPSCTSIAPTSGAIPARSAAP
ncbi:MAG: LLM class flavin-dependent oxidoreductase [Ilumatobacteraceae bacterium]